MLPVSTVGYPSDSWASFYNTERTTSTYFDADDFILEWVKSTKIIVVTKKKRLSHELQFDAVINLAKVPVFLEAILYKSNEDSSTNVSIRVADVRHSWRVWGRPHSAPSHANINKVKSLALRQEDEAQKHN